MKAFAEHGKLGAPMPVDGGFAEAVLGEFRREGIDEAALAERLQREGAAAFSTSWHAMLSRIAQKVSQLDGVASR